MRRNIFMKGIKVAGFLLLFGMLTGCGDDSYTVVRDRTSEAETSKEDDDTDEVDESDDSERTGLDLESLIDELKGNNSLEIIIQNKSHSDYANDDSYNLIYKGSYELIHLSDEAASAYPELSNSLEKYNEDTETAFMSSYEQYKDLATEQYESETGGDYFSSFSDERNISVSRADDQFLCFTSGGSDYMGGAHGSYWADGYNYDVKTGQKLKLKDVITDMDALQELVIQKLKDNYEDAYFLDSIDENVPKYLTGEEDQECSWYLTPQGLGIYFGVYLLGSYADGSQQVQIFYSENPELFFEGFHIQEGDYIEKFNAYAYFYTDIDGDNVADCISVTPEYDDYYNMTSMDIALNGNHSSIEAYGYDISPSIVHKDGKSFLYIDVPEENDYRTTYACSLDADGAKLLETYGGSITGNVPETDYDADWITSWREEFLSPNDLYFEDRMQMLSTYMGISKASIGSDGKLVIDGYYYAQMYDDSRTLTTKESIKGCSEIDPETMDATAKDVAIPEGTVLSIYGTDGENFVDLKDGSGKIYRVNVEIGDWPQKVNGRDIEELFDGLMFAG